MHGLVHDGPGRISYRSDLAEPVLEHPRDAIVEVVLAGLCGSDLHPYEGRERNRPGTVPGHEVVGVVSAAGAALTTLSAGDRVLVPFTTCCGVCPSCRRGVTARCTDGQLFGYGDPDDLSASVLHGGQAARVRVPNADSTAVRVPSGVDDGAALLLTDNLPTAWEAVARAEPTPGEPLVVVGLGAVGLCAVVAAVAAGADPVVGIDPVPGRRVHARSLGAELTLEPADASVNAPRDVGSVVEAAGTPAAQRLAFELVRPGGTMSVISVQTAERFAFTPVDAYDRNLTVRTGRASVRATLDHLLPRVAAGEVAVPVEQVVSHLGVPLRDGPDTYRRFAAREDGFVKAAFDPAS